MLWRCFTTLAFCMLSLKNMTLCSSIDDVEDSAPMRRGAPAAHLIYGIPQTINCANFVYFMAMQRVIELSTDAVQIFNGIQCDC